MLKNDNLKKIKLIETVSAVVMTGVAIYTGNPLLSLAGHAASVGLVTTAKRFFNADSEHKNIIQELASDILKDIGENDALNDDNISQQISFMINKFDSFEKNEITESITNKKEKISTIISGYFKQKLSSNDFKTYDEKARDYLDFIIDKIAERISQDGDFQKQTQFNLTISIAQNQHSMCIDLEEIRRKLDNIHRKKLTLEKPQPYENQKISLEFAFTFTQQMTEFTGREKERDELLEFIRDGSQLKWWQIAGAGGEGKSRLGLELLEHLDWNWDAGFVPKKSLLNISEDDLSFDSPTLIIIDYIAGDNEKTKKFFSILRSLQAKEKELPHRIRFLIIEREGYELEDESAENRVSKSTWFNAPDLSPSERQIAIKTAYRNKALQLDKLSDENMREIARHWRSKNEKQPFTKNGEDSFIAILEDGSTQTQGELWRPLFAMVVAEMVDENGGFGQQEKAPSRWSKEAILEKILRHEQSQWPSGIDKNPPDDYSKKLAILSTLCGGFSWNAFDKISAQGQYGLTNNINNDSNIIKNTWRYLGRHYPHLEEDGIRKHDMQPLTPDLLGEFLILDLLSYFEKNFSKDKFEEDLKNIVTHACEIDIYGMYQCLFRLHNDFYASGRKFKPVIDAIQTAIPVQKRLDLNAASFFGLVKTVELLIKSGADVKQVNTENGAFPLLMASQQGHSEVVKALIEAGADVKQVDTKDGTFPLLIASQNGHNEVVKALIDADADVKQVDTKDGAFPLLMASQNGHNEVVKALIDADADVKQVNTKDGAFPLLIASQNGHSEVVKALIDADADVKQVDTKDGAFPLLIASQNGHSKVVKALIDADADVKQVNTKDGAFPLLIASQNGHNEVVKALIDADADVKQVNTKDGAFPLLIASQNGHSEVVKALIEAGADVKQVNTKYDTFPLLIASQQGHSEVVKALIDADADVKQVNTKDGAFPLLIASQNGHNEVVKALIEAGADVKQVNTKDGAFPLLIASQNGHSEVVKALIEAGADVKQVNTKDDTFPLLIASQQGHSEVVKALIDAGADVKQVNTENGAFPLLMASQNGHNEVVKALIEAGADVKQVNTKYGTFPLLIASQNGHNEVVKALIDADADVKQVNTKDGAFPLLIASQQGHSDIVKALIDAGANLS